MSRALAAAAVVLLAALCPVGALASSPPAQPLMVSTSISPRPSFFGDLLTARTEVLVDANRVDPNSVRVETDFFPYVWARAPLRSASRSGRLVALGYRFSISCLSGDCTPGPGIRRMFLPLLVVRARLRNGRETVVRTPWPQVVLAPRVDEAALRAFPLGWRKQLEVPPGSDRVPPGTLIALLLAGAAALGLAAFAVVASEYARSKRLRRAHASGLSRVALALALSRESMRRNPDDRRKAQALLARELDGKDSDADRLASAAERLAWSRERPDPDRMGALADEVEREVSTR
ncbi:MAG: hypothetical protein QOF50_1066 [Gaiellaceae bacterium]|nr:hypothetical protein [Gaiellaceae bacterium]